MASRKDPDTAISAAAAKAQHIRPGNQRIELRQYISLGALDGRVPFPCRWVVFRPRSGSIGLPGGRSSTPPGPAVADRYDCPALFARVPLPTGPRSLCVGSDDTRFTPIGAQGSQG
ncbi:hypothetical protein GCM10029992_37460 [Glycomyces albus]